MNKTQDINWIGAEELKSKYPLGLMSAPGFTSNSIEEDIQLLIDGGVSLLVGLVDERELYGYGVGKVIPAADDLGLRYRILPIANGGIPEPWQAVALTNDILAAIDEKGPVVIHCIGGMGRTGTIAACCLISRGLTPRDAIDKVRDIRSGAIETAIQEIFIEDFPEFLQKFTVDR